MRFLSLNVNRAGKARAFSQVREVVSCAPDIVAFQEVAVKQAADYRREFEQTDLRYVRDSVGDDTTGLTGLRGAGVLVASRWPCQFLGARPTTLDLPWPERGLTVLVSTPWGPLELHCIYVPVGTQQSRSCSRRSSMPPWNPTQRYPFPWLGKPEPNAAPL